MSVPVILLACGSFNPVTNMHLRMFEIARDYLHRVGQYEVIGGIVSPVHDGYGKKDLEPASHRLSMLKLALHDNDWVKLSEWEARQESWIRTRQILQHHQNHVNAYLQSGNNIDINNDVLNWMPDNIRKRCEYSKGVTVKLLCGADLLESFGVVGLWTDEDIETIVGQHGLVVITRSNINPTEFIYNSDILTKYMSNITIVTEWIRNEISSTKIRRALRRSESVKYLIADKVIDYIHKHSLYGSQKSKYLNLNNSTKTELVSLTYNETTIEYPSPTNCLYICNNNIFNRNPQYDKLSVEANRNNSTTPALRHPGQAVKVVAQKTPTITSLGRVDNIIVDKKTEVRTNKPMKASKSCANFTEVDIKSSKSNSNLKECKSCDENFVKFIFTKHGIQVISDVETIV